LETRIQDALEIRSAGNPDIETLEAIIAEMDAPESYGPGSPLISHQKNTLSTPVRRILFFCSIAILCILFIAIWLADPFSSQWMDESMQEEAAPSTQALP
jgi:hypothetical protein